MVRPPRDYLITCSDHNPRVVLYLGPLLWQADRGLNILTRQRVRKIPRPTRERGVCEVLEGAVVAGISTCGTCAASLYLLFPRGRSCWRSSMAEHRFCKPVVVSSTLTASFARRI